ncbi:hypothetical protein M501DRAFT_935863, partial [Patellaria atrata CBS 101060]
MAANHLPQYLFKYCPLQKITEIRIIKLHPNGTRDADIDCELSVLDLEAKEEEAYGAVSWCWGKAGDGGANKKIRIRHGDTWYSFIISPNLDLALRTLRPSKAGTPKILWIDAICINQDDPREKNNQVPMMAKIY